MYHFDTEQKNSSGIAILNLILMIAFIGLIGAGCSLSIKNSTQSANQFSTDDSMISFFSQSFASQKSDQIIPAKRKLHQSEQTSTVKAGHKTSQLQTSEGDKKIALLSMIFVMLKQG